MSDFSQNTGTVYVLRHIRYAEDEDDETDIKLIGVYSTQGEAEDAIVRMKRLPGFGHYPKGFEIIPFELNDDETWAEGFVENSDQ